LNHRHRDGVQNQFPLSRKDYFFQFPFVSLSSSPLPAHLLHISPAVSNLIMWNEERKRRKLKKKIKSKYPEANKHSPLK
jgi:hypothetical protein